jgi:hypothetical protein
MGGVTGERLGFGQIGNDRINGRHDLVAGCLRMKSRL